jgi:hypothetical protein
MESMNTTLFVICLVLLVYVATCVLQWRRLTHGEKVKTDRPDFRHHER